MENKFLAHIAEDGREQTVFEHLAGAASLSAEFSRPFGGEAQGLLAGTAHDIGKYSAAFQRRLTGDSRRVDHATAGAFECMGRGQPFAAFAVAGHHGGLPDGGGRGDGPEAATFWGRINRAGRGGLEPYGAWAREVSLPGGQPPPFAKQNPGAGMFFIRMLYSVWWPRIFWIPRTSCPGSRAGVVQAAGKEGAFHPATLMYPAHRQSRRKGIRRMLKAAAPFPGSVD